MQIGIDVGATKIESVVLKDNGEESHRSRIDCPKDYLKTVNAIRNIVIKLEKEFKTELSVWKYFGAFRGWLSRLCRLDYDMS